MGVVKLVRIFNQRSRPRLAFEALLGLGAIGEMRRKNLDRYGAVEAGDLRATSPPPPTPPARGPGSRRPHASSPRARECTGAIIDSSVSSREPPRPVVR